MYVDVQVMAAALLHSMNKLLSVTVSHIGRLDIVRLQKTSKDLR